MASASDGAGYIARLGLGRFWRPRSEGWIAALSLAGWAGLLAADGGGGLAGLCSGGGWIGRIAAEWRAGLLAPRLAGCLVMSLAMVAAMMPPLAIEPLRLVAMRSFRWRRTRAAALWLAGYLATWTLAAAVASLALMAVGAPPRPAFAAAAFLAAALWQLTPAKRRALYACHKAQPLPPRGLQADIGCLRFGARVGRACIAACGPMMLAAMTAPWPVLAMAGVFIVALWERYVGNPPLRATALAFAAAAGLLALQGI